MLNLESLAISGTAIMKISVVGLPKMKVVCGCDIEGRDVKTGPGVERIRDGNEEASEEDGDSSDEHNDYSDE